MLLKDIIKNLEIKQIFGKTDLDIQDIIYSSKNARKDTIFTALVGMTSDGHKYIDESYEKGVRTFLISDEKTFNKLKEKQDTTIIFVKDTRDALANISDVFFDSPSKKMTVIGITGTKGKTTVSNYIKTVLENAGISCGVIGTNGIFYADEYVKTVNTTPESYEIQKYMKKMVDNGVRVLAMEVSSGGIMMSRVSYIDYDYAIFTNLSPDHIGDKEHPTFEHYMNCKAKLFSMSRDSIINIDDEKADVMIEKSKKYSTYSIDKASDFIAKKIEYPKSISDIKTYFTVNENEYCVNSFGKFGVYNALCVIAVCEKIGLSYEQIKDGLSRAYVKGRLQILDIMKDIKIIIDYAHNEVSLDNILRTIKELNPKRVITVFGSIGTRAKHRRIELATVSSKYSDIIIVTSDNPDTEDPKSIIDEIISYIPSEKLKNTYTYVDRQEAIKKAIEISKHGDIILLAGKGHEEYQLINGVREHFSDEEQAKKYAQMKNDGIL